MTFRNHAIGFAAVLATLTSVGIAETAQAVALAPDYSDFENSAVVTKSGISARITTGLASGQGGSTGGAFSDFSALAGLTEVNFNNVSATGLNQFTSEGLTFSVGSGKTFSGSSGSTGIYADNWAPSNPFAYDSNSPDVQKNLTNYLAVFQNNSVTVSLGQTMNYFGINWGALSSGNRFILKRGGVEVARFDYEDINPVAPIRAQHQNGGEGNAYLHLYADDDNALFDTLVLEQTTGGGFEVDNFSYIAGDGEFEWDKESVPEPGMVLGLLAIGGAALLKRRNRAEEQEA